MSPFKNSPLCPSRPSAPLGTPGATCRWGPVSEFVSSEPRKDVDQLEP